jgi:hypothetical protein
MIYLNLLVALTLLVLCGTVVTLLIQNYRLQRSWMRIFCERSGIPPTSMDARPEAPKEVVAPKPKKLAFSIPIPGAEQFRKIAK